MFHFDALPSCYSDFGIWTSNLCTSKTGKLYRWKQFNLLKRVVISTSFTVDFQFWNFLPSPFMRAGLYVNEIEGFLIFVFSCQLQVREIVSILDIDVLFYPCPKDGPNFRPKANEMGGKKQFPYMVRRLTPNIALTVSKTLWTRVLKSYWTCRISVTEDKFVGWRELVLCHFDLFQSSPMFSIRWSVDVPSGVAWCSEINSIFKHVYAN